MAKHLLVVDDEEEIRFILKATLEDEGFIVTTARDGGEGSKFIDENKYDGMLFDISMPVMTGIELCYHARNSELNNQAAILIISGHIDDKVAQQAETLGIVKLLHKPFKSEEVLRVLNKEFADAS